MHDIVIRGGTIIDGTGKPAFTGDVAIAGAHIAEVGGKQGPGRREIDAAGLLVTPGWVGVHTHYDGQAMWDPLLSPSCWHGVTTAMFGNCGVGFAPVRPQHRAALMDLMEGGTAFPIFWMRWSAARTPSTSPPKSHICRCGSMLWGIAPFDSRRPRLMISPRCAGSPRKPCAPARLASPLRGRTRTKPRPARWSRPGTPVATSWWASALHSASSGRVHSE